MTDAERKLWSELRDRRLGGHKFRSQRTIWPHVADFCCVKAKLIVEVDGSQHSEAADADRTAALKKQGFRIIRFWNNDVLQNMDGVLTVLLDALGGAKKEEEDPHPNPLPRAGEGM